MCDFLLPLRLYVPSGRFAGPTENPFLAFLDDVLESSPTASTVSRFLLIPILMIETFFLTGNCAVAESHKEIYLIDSDLTSLLLARRRAEPLYAPERVDATGLGGRLLLSRVSRALTSECFGITVEELRSPLWTDYNFVMRPCKNVSGLQRSFWTLVSTTFPYLSQDVTDKSRKPQSSKVRKPL